MVITSIKYHYSVLVRGLSLNAPCIFNMDEVWEHFRLARIIFYLPHIVIAETLNQPVIRVILLDMSY